MVEWSTGLLVHLAFYSTFFGFSFFGIGIRAFQYIFSTSFSSVVGRGASEIMGPENPSRFLINYGSYFLGNHIFARYVLPAYFAYLHSHEELQEADLENILMRDNLCRSHSTQCREKIAEVLEISVEDTSSTKNLKTAYRNLALRFHPDRPENRNNPNASEPFTEIGLAYKLGKSLNQAGM